MRVRVRFLDLRIETLWRHLVLSYLLVALLIGSVGSVRAEGDGQDAFAVAVQAMEQRVGGSIGVFAADTGSGQTLAYRADDRFAMASTFKPLLVAAVLDQVDAGTLSLDDAVNIEGFEIQPYSPVIDELGEARTITLAALCDAAITLGDNTATNVLLDLAGGPAGLTQFLRQQGDEVTRLDRYEVELNMNARDDERDTTTPRAMANSLLRVLSSDILSGDSTRVLADWLVASKTGANRLRAGLPAAWRIGDKTGTGMNGAVNNVAVAWPAGGGMIVIAVYMSWSEKDVGTLSAAHAEIAALVTQHLVSDRPEPE